MTSAVHKAILPYLSSPDGTDPSHEFHVSEVPWAEAAEHKLPEDGTRDEWCESVKKQFLEEIRAFPCGVVILSGMPALCTTLDMRERVFYVAGYHHERCFMMGTASKETFTLDVYAPYLPPVPPPPAPTPSEAGAPDDGDGAAAAAAAAVEDSVVIGLYLDEDGRFAICFDKSKLTDLDTGCTGISEHGMQIVADAVAYAEKAYKDEREKQSTPAAAQ